MLTSNKEGYDGQDTWKEWKRIEMVEKCLEGRRKAGRPRKRQIDGFEEDLKGIGVRGQRRMEGDCGEGQIF